MIRITSLLAAAVMLIAPANAASITQGAFSVELPPARYDHEPSQPFELHYWRKLYVEAFCGADALGCTLTDARIVVVRNDLPRKVRAAVVRHEKGHLNGWRH